MALSRSSGPGGGQPIVQRISLAGAEEVKRLLEQMGTQGEKAAAQIGAAMAASGGNTAALGTAVEGAFTRIGQGATKLKPVQQEIREVENRFHGVGGAITAIGEVLLPDLVSKIGAGAGAIALGFKEILGSASKSIINLRNLSLESGLTVKSVQGITKVFEENNISAEKLPLVLGKFADALGKARLEAQQLEGPLASPFAKAGEQVNVVRGDLDKAKTSIDGVTTVFRGAAQQVRDTSTAFKSLGMDAAFLKRFPDTMEGNLAALIEFSRRLGAVTSDTEKARIGTEMFGKGWKTTAAAILQIAPELEHAIGAVAAKGLGVTEEDQHRALEYNKAVKELGDQWERTIQVIGVAVFPFFGSLAQRTEESIGYMRGTFGAFGNLVTAAFQAIDREWGTTLGNMKISADEFKAAVVAAIEGIIPGLALALKAINFVQNAAERLRNSVPGGPPTFSAPIPPAESGSSPSNAGSFDPYSKPPDYSPSVWGPTEVRPVEQVNPDFVIKNGLAGGGQVRGPGGIDRVPLWGTAGEFMHQVRAVQFYGLDFMRKINAMQLPRFEMGGLVESIHGMGPQHLAGGGMVMAGAGGGRSEFTIVLDNRPFTASADRSVASSLLRTALKEKIVSAGRRPGRKS